MNHDTPVNQMRLRWGAAAGSLALVLFVGVTISQATLVRHISGTTTNTVFVDDFEGGTVGATPTATVGTWQFFGTSVLVTNSPTPGPAKDGSNYLKLSRVTAASIAEADFGALSTGQLQLAYALYIPVGSPNFVVGTYLSNQISDNFGGYTTAKVALEVRPALDNRVYYDTGSGLVDTGITYQPGQWQNWQINYLFVPGAANDTWTVTVGSQTSAALHGGPGGAESVASLRYLSFRTGANNSQFFLDASMVPEPSLICLLAAGALVGWRFTPRRPSSKLA